MVEVEVRLGLGSQRMQARRYPGPAHGPKTLLATHSELASWPALLEGKADANRLGVAAVAARWLMKWDGSRRFQGLFMCAD